MVRKDIKINGENIVFETNNQTPLIYKKHFKKDFFQRLSRSFSRIPNNLNPSIKSEREQIIDNMDTMFFYEMVWTLAKTADPKIPKMEKWLRTMPDVPILELAVQLSPLIPPLVKQKVR